MPGRAARGQRELQPGSRAAVMKPQAELPGELAWLPPGWWALPVQHPHDFAFIHFAAYLSRTPGPRVFVRYTPSLVFISTQQTATVVLTETCQVMEKEAVGMMENRNSGPRDLCINSGDSGSPFCQQNMPLTQPASSGPRSGIGSAQKPFLVA